MNISEQHFYLIFLLSMRLAEVSTLTFYKQPILYKRLYDQNQIILLQKAAK